MIKILKKYFVNEEGVAAVEAAMIFPILLVMMLATYDLGNGILANQKVVRSSQVVADLIARNREVDNSIIDEAVEAGRLAMQPFPMQNFAFHIVSYRWDEDEDLERVWEEPGGVVTGENMDQRVAPLAEAGEGVVMVIVEYTFVPLFAGFLVDEISMQEVAFARGRKSAVVERPNS